ncbi:MAG: FAD-dependent oxidoreductase [Planctomycetota bacterium]
MGDLTAKPLRIAVIGGGVGGLATAFFLSAEEGAEVSVFERERTHGVHSSGRSAEILRAAIEQPFTAKLALRSGEMLRDPAQAGLHGESSFVDDRGLFVLTSAAGTPGWLTVHQDERSVNEIQLADLASIAPHFRPAGERCFHFPICGRIDTARLLASLARGAAERGVAIRRGVSDAVPEVRGSRITGVRIGNEFMPFDRVIVAAGAWSRGIGERLGVGVDLRSTRRHMWVASCASEEAASRAPIVWDDEAGFYARPEALPGGGYAWAFSSTDLDEYSPGPDEHGDDGLKYRIDPEVEAAAYEMARRHLPNEPLERIRAWRGFRDLAPDDRPLLGADDTIDGLFWCAGLGGHGMSVSLGAGEIVAKAALEDRRTPATL